MNNEKLLGKWEDLKFSYDFQKNNTVELYWKDKNITEKGIYSIEENILNLKYGKYYKGSWKGEIVSISKKKLELKDLTIDSRDYGKIETYIRVKEEKLYSFEVGFYLLFEIISELFNKLIDSIHGSKYSGVFWTFILFLANALIPLYYIIIGKPYKAYNNDIFDSSSGSQFSSVDSLRGAFIIFLIAVLVFLYKEFSENYTYFRNHLINQRLIEKQRKNEMLRKEELKRRREKTIKKLDELLEKFTIEDKTKPLQ